MFRKNVEKLIKGYGYITKEDHDAVVNELTERLAALSIFTADTTRLITDKQFVAAMAKAVEVQRVVNLQKLRERELEEFTEKELEMENSSEPWCDVMTIGHDPEKGWANRAGWNTAMIQKLKEEGFKGESEEHIIQQYIGRLGIDNILSEYNE